MEHLFARRICIFAITLLSMLAISPLAQAYTPEQQGTYLGTINGKDYASGTAVAYKGPATLTVGSSSWTLDLPNLYFTGTENQLMLSTTNGMIIHDSVPSFHLHASLHLISGGASIKGPALLQTELNGNIYNNVEAKLSLKKQVP